MSRSRWDTPLSFVSKISPFHTLFEIKSRLINQISWISRSKCNIKKFLHNMKDGNSLEVASWITSLATTLFFQIVTREMVS